MRAARRAAILAGGERGQPLRNLLEGDRLKIIEAGNAVPFYVAKHDYESSLNQTGRTLVVRQHIYDKRQWHSSSPNAYAASNIDAWLNGTYFNLLDEEIRGQIAAVTIPYTPGNGNNTVTTLFRKVFLLSVTELGKEANYANIEGSALPLANILQIATDNGGTAQLQWTRSPSMNRPSLTCTLRENGDVGNNHCDSAFGARPAFTLPFDLPVSLRPDADGCYTVV